MRIKVEAIDHQTFFQLQDTAPKGVTVKLGGTMLEGAGSNQPVAAVITFTAAGMESDAIGTWLYDKIKGKPAKVSVNRIRTILQQDEIKRLIQEEMKKE